MTARLRVGALVVGLLGVAGVLAGCVNLPDSSSVQRGNGAGVRHSSFLVFNQPPGPQAGADRTSIVDHFLQAMLSFPRAPGVVREFLTPTAAHEWDPEERLRVYQQPVVEDGPAGTVTLSGTVLGSLDLRGSWVPAGSSTDALDVVLKLTKVRGEWRISNPPSGTLLDTDFFARYYQQYSLFYFDPMHTLLTPDPVYLLLGNAGETADALVRDLLQGPTVSMGGVVSAEVPTDTRLTGPVRVAASGLAQVPLSPQVTTMSSARLRYFAAQLSWTLRQEHLGVTRVRLVAAGRAVPVPGLGDSFSVLSSQGYDPSGWAAKGTLYALSDQRHLVSVSPDGVAAVAGPIGDWKVRARSAAVNQSGTLGALVSYDGTRVVVGDVLDVAADSGALTRWFPRPGDAIEDNSVLKPSWDVHDVLWLVARTGSGAQLHIAAQGKSHVLRRTVNAPGITGEDVRAFALSRDGMRAAVIIGTGANAKLVVASVRRSATSRMDVSLTNVRGISDANFPLKNLTAVAWLAPTSLIVLAQENQTDPQPYQVAIDGSRVQPTTGFIPVRPKYLAAGASDDTPQVVGSARGSLYGRDVQQQWTKLGSGQSLFAPTYVG